MPYVVSQYNTTTKVMATLDQLFSDLISAVGKTNAQEVFTFGCEECTFFLIAESEEGMGRSGNVFSDKEKTYGRFFEGK